MREVAENVAVAGGGEAPENLRGAAREWYAAGFAVLGDRQEGNAPVEIHGVTLRGMGRFCRFDCYEACPLGGSERHRDPLRWREPRLID